MSSALPMPYRQRSMLPDMGGALEGWMDEDVAAAAGQLFGDGPAGLLVIDATELLTSTARVVGARLGDLHFKVWMAVITLYVNSGRPENGTVETSLGELGRLIWGSDTTRGGTNSKRLLRALHDLRQVTFAVPGYDFATHQLSKSVSDTGLLINLGVDETLLRAYQGDETLDKAEVGRGLGGKGRGTIKFRLHPDYVEQLADVELRRFNWVKAQQLRGVALMLWMTFTSPRIPYRPMFERDGDLEHVEIALTEDHCNALGVRAATDAARRRTFNEAGPRVIAADSSFVSFEAQGGRGKESFLRVVRHRPRQSPLDRPLVGKGQMELQAA